MRYAAFALPALLLLGACSSRESSQNQAATTSIATDSATAAAPLEPLDTTRASKVDAQSDTLKQVQRRHPFSSAAQPDLFTLTLRGKTLLDGEATFTITTSSGNVIFREILSAADLEAAMVYDLQGNTPPTPAQREAYLRRRMDEFFADQNFHQPALPASATQPGSLDRATWNDLRQRPDAIAFDYLVGKEDRRRIVWSPQKKQVVKLDGLGS